VPSLQLFPTKNVWTKRVRSRCAHRTLKSAFRHWWMHQMCGTVATRRIHQLPGGRNWFESDVIDVPSRRTPQHPPHVSRRSFQRDMSACVRQEIDSAFTRSWRRPDNGPPCGVNRPATNALPDHTDLDRTDLDSQSDMLKGTCRASHSVRHLRPTSIALQHMHHA